MGKKRLTKTMWYGADIDISGNPILPEIAPDGDDLAGLNEGEIYIHNHPDKPSIWIRTTDGKIVSVSGVDISVLEKIFLSKTKDDRSKGKIATDKAIEVGDFVSGASGAMIYKDETTGQTVGELDKLYVRMKAYFETLEIINVNTIGGKQILSPAGSVKCVGVDTLDNAYRCYFLAEQDGEKINNRFLAGDQIYSQTFDAVEGTSQNVSIHYFWRLCTAVSTEPIEFEGKMCHYMDLSTTDCDENSDIPIVGDVLNQRGNRTDLDRMNFIEQSSVDAYSPNITLFHGVNSYSLAGKEYVSYGVDKSTNKAFMNVYGDMYVGDRQGGSYMRYTQEGGLEISGTLSVGTKLGDTLLKDLISASTPEGYQEFVEKVTQDIEGLQNQIDGAIDSYFYQYEPTLGNYPASEWTTEDEKKAHLNDTFTNLVDGRSWRWSLDGTTYKWVEITDTATTQALALAGQAKDTADGKRRVFVDTPKPPYDKGDLWSRGSDYPLMICVTPKDASGVYAESDFDYADNNTKLKEELQTLVSTTKDDLNNAIGQAKDEAVNNANAYTDDGKKALQASIDELEKSKANIDNVYTIAQADNKISEAETSAINAAKKQADAAIALSETTIKAYADGVVDDEEKARIKQAQENLAEAKKYAEEQAQAVKDDIENSYLFQALTESPSTDISNGLVLTSLIQLRDTESNIMSGINGLINANKGDKSIATWWGGGMYDLEDYFTWNGEEWVVNSGTTVPSNIPSGLIRMDGTGYFAKGNFWWDANGKIYADPTALFLMFDVEDEAKSLSSTILALRDKQTEFESMWSVKTDSNGVKYLYSTFPLATQGGITMYTGTEGLDMPSIYNGLPIDGTTIYWENGVLKSLSGGGTADAVAWGNITDKPSWIGDTKPSYSYSELTGTKPSYNMGELSNVGTWANSVADVDRIMYQAAGSSMWVAKSLSDLAVGGVSGDYLPLSGGKLTGVLKIDSSVSSAATLALGSGNKDGLYYANMDILDDTTLKNNFVLYANGTAELNGANILTSSNYSSYALPLSGGTITGSSNTPLVLKGESTNTWIAFRGSDNTFFGSIGVRSDNFAYLYSGGLTHTIWTSGNDGSGSGLDADLLDGWNGNHYFRGVFDENIDFNKFTDGSYDNHFYYVHAGYTQSNRPPIDYGGLLNLGVDTMNAQIAIGNNSKLFFRHRWWSGNGGNWVAWKEIASTDSNVASATKLQTARTIWGQSFDGTGNVDGDMHFNASNGRLFRNGRQLITLHDSFLVLGYDNCPDGKSTYLDGYDIRLRTGNSWSTSMLIDGYGNVGIGTTSPTSKLSVKGNIDSYDDGDYSGVIGFNRKSNTGGLFNTSYHGHQIHNYKGDLRFFVEKTDNTILTPITIIGNSGNVGIGTTSPSYKLDVVGGIRAYTGDVYANAFISETWNNHANATAYNALDPGHSMFSSRTNWVVGQNTVQPMLTWCNQINNIGYRTRYSIYSYRGTGGWGAMCLGVGNNDDGTTRGIELSLSGYGTATLYGNFLVTGGITMYGSSDRRLKKNIRTFNASQELMKLGGVYQFEYNDDEIERNSMYKGSHIGLIYQNVKGTVLDKMCYEREDGYGALNYLDTSFISLIAAVGIEHETRIQKLERENKELRQEIKRLKSA